MIRINPAVLVAVLVFAACNDSTAPADTCADFQGTWNTQGFVYTASADPTTAADLSSVASIDMTVDDNCNFTGTAFLPGITQDTAAIDGSFTLDPRLNTLDLVDTTAIGPALNYTYQYTLSGNTLTLVNHGLEYDFDGQGPNPSLPTTLTITFVRQ